MRSNSLLIKPVINVTDLKKKKFDKIRELLNTIYETPDKSKFLI